MGKMVFYAYSYNICHFGVERDMQLSITGEAFHNHTGTTLPWVRINYALGGRSI